MIRNYIRRLYAVEAGTKRITYGKEDPAAEFIGYTALASISDRRDIDGGVLVQLQKGD